MTNISQILAMKTKECARNAWAARRARLGGWGQKGNFGFERYPINVARELTWALHKTTVQVYGQNDQIIHGVLTSHFMIGLVCARLDYSLAQPLRPHVLHPTSSSKRKALLTSQVYRGCLSGLSLYRATNSWNGYSLTLRTWQAPLPVYLTF